MLRAISPSATVVVGLALKAAGNYPVFTLQSDGGGTDQLTLATTAGGYLEVRRGTFTGALLATSATPIILNSWHYIEMKATIADSGGMVEVRIDGVSRLSFSGDTRNGGTSTNTDVLYFPGYGTSATGSIRVIDDIYICDGSGAVNNDFLGDIKIETLYPNANGANSQLSGSDGNQIDNYQLVDEVGVPVTSDYVSSAVVGARDTYAFSNLTTSTGPIKGLQINAYANKSDAGSRSIKGLAVSGGSIAIGTARPLQTSYLPHLTVHEVDPNGGGAWTIASINNAEFGIEVDA